MARGSCKRSRRGLISPCSSPVQVSAADIINAERLFGPMAHLVTSQLPQFRLTLLVGDSRKKQMAALGEEGKSRKGDKGDKSHVEQAGRAAFTYTPPDVRAAKQVRGGFEGV